MSNTIWFKLQTGQTVVMEVNNNTSVREMKHFILSTTYPGALAEGITEDYITLIYSGDILQDSLKAETLFLQKVSVVHVAIKPIIVKQLKSNVVTKRAPLTE